MDLSCLSDDELFGRVEALAQTERFSLTDFLLHLGELDNRPACERKGYSSVFAYLTRKLGYAESDAIRRVRVARATRRFPSILRMLAAGELHLVSVALLQPHLTPKNHERLLRAASHKSTREVEAMAKALLPAAPGPRDTMRALPPPQRAAPAATADSTEGALAPSLPDQTASEGTNLILESGPEPTEGSADVAHERRLVFTFSADERVRDLFKQAQDLLRHKFPEGSMEEIIGEALRRLVEDELPTSRRPSRPSNTGKPQSRRIPRWVQDEVWRRDGGRCVYMGPEGVRCGETAWLEFDHVKPWALGGRSDAPSNIRLLCRAHNQEESRRILGAFPRQS